MKFGQREREKLKKKASKSKEMVQVMKGKVVKLYSVNADGLKN